MELYSMIWTIVESLAFLAVVIIFFNDPIRRWNFFGYRPTAVMGLFDPKTKKVLFSKVSDAWSFNQGGMYQNNIHTTIIGIIKRELGISQKRYKFLYSKPLGPVPIQNKKLLNRDRISTVSIFQKLRGKAYLACFIGIDLKDIEKEIEKGSGVQETKIVSIEKAKEMVLETKNIEHNPEKQKYILSMLEEIEAFIKDAGND